MSKLSQHLKLSLIIFSILLFNACDSEEVNPPTGGNTGTGTNTNNENEVPVITPTGDEKYMTVGSDYIFDQDKLLTFELTLPAASLADLDADPAAEEYVEGSLTFEGETVSPVGIRYKGSIGGFVNCVSGSDWSNPSGFKTCTKLSMKIKINWNGADTRFYGLNKLQFHSQNLDPTQMHDRLGYYLFRSMGVPAPRSVHARLIINGQYVGLFSLVEQIDGRFVKYNFSDDDGNLYKEIWPVTMHGQPFSEATYLNHLKTNEEDNPSAAIMRSFGQAISVADSAQMRDVITTRMDLNKIITYAVVDRMIKNDDGAFHWYCGGGDCSNHNYYWYEEPASSKLHLIPWDLDNAFENIQFATNAVTPIADDWGETRNNCQPFVYGWLNLPQRSAACDKLTAGWASFKTEYEQIKTQFIQSSFSESNVNALLDAWTAQIRAATIEAANTHDDALSVDEWDAAVANLKAKLHYARTH